MKLPPDSEIRAYSAMRSLFRYVGFKEMGSPDILIEYEKKILEKRFKDLTSEELCFVVTQWPAYYKEQLVESEIQIDQIMTAVEKEIENMN